MLKNLNKGYGILLIGVLLSAIQYILTTYIFKNFPDIDIINITTWSFLSVALFVSPFFLTSTSQRSAVKKELKNNKWLLIKVTLITSFGAILWFYALKFGEAGLVAFLRKSDIIFILLLGRFMLHEKISKQELIGMAITIPGFFLLTSSSFGEISVFAILAIIVAQMLYALFSFFIKRDAKNMNALIFSWLRIFGMGCMFFIFGMATKSLNTVPLIPLIIFSTGLLFGGFLYRAAYLEAHKHLEISKISIFLLISPVVILFASWLFLDEAIHSKKVIGAAIILVGLLVFTLGKTLKQPVKK